MIPFTIAQAALLSRRDLRLALHNGPLARRCMRRAVINERKKGRPGYIYKSTVVLDEEK